MKPSFEKKGKLGKIAAILCGAVFTLAACGKDDCRVVNSTDTAMGTIIVQHIYVVPGKDFKAVETYGKADEEFAPDRDILNIIDAMEVDELSWRIEGSEVYRINSQAGASEGTELSSGLSELLDTCLDVSDTSDGAFDITIGDVARLWNIDAWSSGVEIGEYIIPSPEAISDALNNTGYEKINVENSRIFLPENMSIDLGAVGKGAALDRIGDYLENEPSVSGAVISVGGSVLTYGTKPDGASWNIGIVDPFDTSRNLGVVSLEGGWCISTSGDYERFVEADGVRYHHIMDPDSGYPADSGLHSVTIITEDGALSDALSTACFIMGKEKGLELAEKYGAEALMVGDGGEITMTDGMKEIFNLSNQ